MKVMNSAKKWDDFFPYTPRKLQLGMIKIISSYLQKRTHMVLEASTGIGKTIVNLASILPYAKENGFKVIYTARTHSQMDRVIEELQKISEKEPVSGIAMRGRESFCLNSMVLKNANSNRALQVMCKHLKTTKKCEYFVNMKNEKILHPVLREFSIRPATAEYIFDISQSAKICPAEAVRKVLPEVDVVACSYLYLFDPDIRKSFLESMNVELQDLIVIIDEAHNLPDMVKNVTSDSMSSFSMTRATREAMQHGRDDFVKFYDSVVEFLSEQNKKMKLYDEVAVDAGVILENLELQCGLELDDEFFSDMLELGESIRYNLAKVGKDPRSSLGSIGEFFFKWYDSIGHDDFTYSMEKKVFQDGKETYVVLNLNALDPSKGIYPVLSNVETSLSVTGTLGDPTAYTLLTGINRLNHISNIFPSPYDDKNVKTLVLKELSTLYKQRTPAMYKRIVNAICAVAADTPANVGLFVPSYKIMEELLSYGLEDFAPKDLIITKSGMKSAENDLLIDRFKKKANRGGAILCTVLGGRSSEGSDFPGDTMNTVIVVGIPFAPPTVRVKAQIDYMDKKFPGKGWLLSYQIPAINRAAQAAGRPVRSLDDKALIVFIDYRYDTGKVKTHLPGWIRDSIEYISPEPSVISHKTRTFFKNHNMA